MASLNKVQAIGNLGKDPEVKQTASGAVVNFTVAVNESWKDKNSGEKVEKTEWINCSAFGKLAEIIGQYLQKGSSVYVEGKLRTRKWQNKEGQDQYTTEVIVDTMQMLGGKADGGGRARDSYQPEPAKSSPSGDVPGDDDIPF